MSNNNNIIGSNAMSQLELRAYSREEIAEVLGVNLKDTNHFKRNVESKLTKWGYSYEYSRKEVKIIAAPATAEEKLSEIMIRAYDMDIRIDSFSFAAFLYSLVVFPDFISMPWEERSKYLEEEFGISVSDRTLRSWCSRFIETRTVIKDDEYKTRWITGYVNGEKYRDLVDGDEDLEKFADDYQKEKMELLNQYKDLDDKEKWSNVRRTLWDKYHCCVYCCKGIMLSAWNDALNNETLKEVIELVNEIAEKEPVDTKVVVEQHMESTPIPVKDVNKEGKFIF